MTEQRAIKILKEEMGWESDSGKIQAFAMAIAALEEIQQYRAVGTLDEMKQLKENGAFTGAELAELAIMQMKLKEYQAIGTPDECQIAMIKYLQSKPEKPEITSKFYMCKRCGRVRSVRQKHAFCEDCGCEFDWSEEPEMRSE